MADPNRRADIINAAKQVFAEHGFHKATIKRIAQQAQLKSPALIYWYFSDKEELMHACMASVSPLSEDAVDPTHLFTQPPEVVLPLIASKHLGALENEEGNRLFRIFFNELSNNPQLAKHAASVANPVMGMLQAYLAEQVRIGRFRTHDTSVSARQVMGVSVMYALNKHLLPAIGGGPPERDHYIQESMTTLIRGLERTPQHAED